MPLFGPPDVGKLETKRDIPGLVKALGYRKAPSGAQVNAAEAFGRLADARALEPLIVTLEDKDRYVAQAAAHALGHIGDPVAIEPLIDQLRAPETVLATAITALVEIGDPAVEPLIAALSDQDAARMSTRALGEIGDPRAVPDLIGLLKSGNADLRRAAGVALGKIGDFAVEPLAGVIAESDPVARVLAAEALGELGTPAAVEPLSTSLQDESRQVREAAASALGKIGDHRAAEPLVTALGDQTKKVREAAAAALEAMGWQPDATATGAKFWVVKRQWARCIEIGGPAVEPLIAVLTQQSKDVRKGAAKALGKIGDTRAVDPLLAALGDADASGGEPFARALGDLDSGP